MTMAEKPKVAYPEELQLFFLDIKVKFDDLNTFEWSTLVQLSLCGWELEDHLTEDTKRKIQGTRHGWFNKWIQGTAIDVHINGCWTP